MRNVDPILSNKLNSQYQTKANNAQPKMSVAIARARNTVSDSSYWIKETIRTGAGLGDVSLAPRRQRVTGPPNRIYEIHVQNGVVGTAIRVYPDKFKDGWQNQFSLGAGTNVAIAFDGEWERYRNLWRLVTHEKPWIFWVDDTGKLWTQHWDDVATKQELATGVEYCRAIRGWKNLNIADHDQGIVIGYIKTDGKVYYRNYCQMLDLSYTWEPERQVTEFTGTAESLNLFVTNDYRMGFAVEDSLGDIYWYITDRDWAGMAIAPENIELSSSVLLDFLYITKISSNTNEYISASSEVILDYLFARTDNTFIYAENAPMTRLDENEQEYQDWGWQIEFEVNYPIPQLLLSQVSVEVVDNATTIPMVSLEDLGDNRYRLTADSIVENGFNDYFGDFKITMTGATNQAGYTYDTISITFTPTNLEPEYIPLPEVEVIWNE